MRPAWRYIPPALAALVLGLTGCASGGGTATSTPTPSPTPAAAVCPFGDWRSTQVAASGSAVGVTLTLQGGSGVTLTVAPDGAVKADFTPMQPITFTGQAAGVEVKGESSYQGPISGTVNLSGTSGTPSPGASPTATPGASASPGAATPSPGPTGGTGTSGPWQPVGQVAFADLLVTAKVTAPVSATIADKVKISEITGSQTSQVGNAVDLQPLLRPGEYRCDGDQLTIALSGGTAPPVTWTFARA